MDIEEKVKHVLEAGFNRDDVFLWYEKYRRHLASAKSRGLESQLSFDEYLVKAQTAGISDPESIGKQPGQFQLGRVGDVGDYVGNNCRFITVEQNQREKVENGRMAIAGQKSAEKLRGRTKENDPIVAAMADKLRGRTKETHSYLAEHSTRMTGRSAETHAGLAVMVEKNSKPFVLIDPNGVRYEGKNLADFCREHNFNKGGMSAVCRGTLAHYKGWTGGYVEDDQSPPPMAV